MECKIKNSERCRKLEKKKFVMNHTTPPKFISKRSNCNTLTRMAHKFGYDTERVGETRFEKQKREEFECNAEKYLGGKTFAKKQTRFDKM